MFDSTTYSRKKEKHNARVFCRFHRATETIVLTVNTLRPCGISLNL